MSQLPQLSFNFIPVKNTNDDIQPLFIKPPQKVYRGIVYQNRLNQILPPHFVMVILGKPGSGKTHLLTTLLTQKQFLANKFDRILYLSPSSIPGITHKMGVNTYKNMQTKWILQKIQQCKPWCKNMLVVIDDLVSEIPSNQKCEFQHLLFNRLHKLKGQSSTVSFIITTQKITSLPTYVRTCANVFITFQTPQPQVKRINDQINTGKSKKVIQYLYASLRNPHFYIINTQKGEIFNDNFIKI